MGFASYDHIAVYYDAERVPAGLEQITSALQRSETPLRAQVVLDAGCGTGNYTFSLKTKVRAVEGLEANQRMLARAREKLDGVQGVTLRPGNILDLPSPEASFDAVVCNFVLHHLDPLRGRFRKLEVALEEFWRVLKPGGVVCIQTANHEQIRDGYWWAALIPEAVARAQARYIPISDLSGRLRAHGFEEVEQRLLVDEVLQGEGYLNPRGPLEASFRNADSTWALASEEELERAQARTRALIDEDLMDGFLTAREALRRRCGQATFVSARKPGYRKKNSLLNRERQIVD